MKFARVKGGQQVLGSKRCQAQMSNRIINLTDTHITSSIDVLRTRFPRAVMVIGNADSVRVTIAMGNIVPMLSRRNPQHFHPQVVFKTTTRARSQLIDQANQQRNGCEAARAFRSWGTVVHGSANHDSELLFRCSLVSTLVKFTIDVHRRTKNPPIISTKCQQRARHERSEDLLLRTNLIFIACVACPQSLPPSIVCGHQEVRVIVSTLVPQPRTNHVDRLP